MAFVLSKINGYYDFKTMTQIFNMIQDIKQIEVAEIERLRNNTFYVTFSINAESDVIPRDLICEIISLSTDWASK